MTAFRSLTDMQLEAKLDPYPWTDGVHRWVVGGGSGAERFFAPRVECLKYSPTRPPVNRILERIRFELMWDYEQRTTYPEWLDYLDADFGRAALNDGLYTPDEIDHARKVISRLASE